MDKPTVLIAEDDAVIRIGYLEPLLTPYFTVVASVGDGNEAVTAAAAQKPTVVLLDISLPGLRGFDTAREILRAQPQCKVLLVSNYLHRAYLEAAKQMGLSGYVLKSRAQTELVPAIQEALAGGGFFSLVFR